jgi:DNA polymerase-3 subunit delta'
MRQEIPHPRQSFDWAGEGAHEGAFVEALERGRLHHAWLVTGPPGVGKATFAYRAARRLLGARAAPEHGVLGSGPGDPVSSQISARSSPDLLVLQTEVEDGKARRFIPVDEARRVAEFFSKSPAAAPYRVAIIDAADDLNGAAANAVLKILEEPPTRGVLFLLSHAPGRLLATIRSRCRRLAVSPPSHDVAQAWLTRRAEIDDADAGRLLAMARGAPGGAWRLAVAGALDADEAAQALVRALPAPSPAQIQALAGGFQGGAGAARFALVFDRLADHIRQLAAEALDEPGQEARAARLAEVWSLASEAPRRVEAINLDRTEVFLDVLSRLRAIA